MHHFEDQLIRLALGKTPNEVFNPGVHTGKLAEEKILTTRDAWVKFLSRTFPGVDVVDKTGYKFSAADSAATKPDDPEEASQPNQ